VNFDCPHCNKVIILTLVTPESAKGESRLLGAQLLNYYIDKSGMMICEIAKRVGIYPNTLSNLKLGRTGIGHKNALRLAEFFGHPSYFDFLCNRSS